MSKQKRLKTKYSLVVVAHPDDETLFFAGRILKEPHKNWHVICVTDGNADGFGEKRHQELLKACRALGVKKVTQLDLPDKFEHRLNPFLIQNHLESYDGQVKEVFTHGPTGEYGHPHHQDVSYAVHHFFCKKKIPVWGVAQNCHPEHVVALSTAQYKKKCQILSEIYFEETERFIHLIPATFTEGFCRFSLTEVEHLYEFLTHKTKLNPAKLKHYRWLTGYLESFKQRAINRLF